MASAEGTKDCEKIKAHDQGEERFPEPDTKCIDKETEVQDCEKIAPETGEKKHESEKEKKNNKKQKDKETAERDRELKEGAQEMEEEAEEEKKDKKEKKEKKDKDEGKDEKKKEREGAQEMEEEEEEKKDKKEKKEKKEKGGSKDEKKKKEKKEKDPAQYSAEKLKQKLEKIDAKLQKMLLQKEEYVNLLKQAEQRHLEEEKPEPCEGPNETVKIKEKGLENLPDEIDSLSISKIRAEVTITEVSKQGNPTVSEMCSKVEETTVRPRPVGN